MSCIRSCYDKDSSNFEHDDCKTCIHGDRPQQRTWVGLTDDELNMLGDRMKTWNSTSLKDIYIAIEAKLREKNSL
jgi:hypothetical protein